MAQKSQLVQYPEYLHYLISGTFNLQDSIDHFTEVLGDARSSGITRILYDSRNMQGYPDATAKIVAFENIKFKHDSFLRFGGEPLRIAFLSKENNVREHTPGLNVLRQSALNTVLTADFNYALAWLGINNYQDKQPDIKLSTS